MYDMSNCTILSTNILYYTHSTAHSTAHTIDMPVGRMSTPDPITKAVNTAVGM